MEDGTEIETCPVCKTGMVKYVMYKGFPYLECNNCDHWDYGNEEDITYVMPRDFGVDE